MPAKPFALIVEDDEDLSIIFSEALLAAGFSTHIVRDGQDAVNWLQENVPTLVILDLHLPSVSGKTILANIRREERLRSVKVIVTTADARMAEETQNEVEVALIKPISFSMLRELTARFRTFADEG